MTSNTDRLDEAIEKGPMRVIKDFEILPWYKRRKGIGAYSAGGSSAASGSHTIWSGTPTAVIPYKPQCVHKGDRILTLGKGPAAVTFWALQSAQIRGLAPHLDLWMPLNATSQIWGDFVIQDKVKGDEATRALAFALKGKEINTIPVDWPDRGIPTCNPLQFWPTLITGLQGMAMGKNKGKDVPTPLQVAFSCFGAHGRTGTALGLMLVLAGMGGEDAIKTVRTIHCSEAIEGKQQEDYLKWVDSHVEKVVLPILLHPKAAPKAQEEKKS